MSRLLPAVLLVAAPVAAQPPLPKPVAVFSGHTETVYSAAVAPNGKTAATGSFDRSIKLWALATGKPERTLGGKNGHQNQVLGLAFSPDGKLLASGGSDNVAKVWDLAAGKPDDPDPAPAKTLAHPNLVDAVAFDKTGKLLATACHDGILRVWDVEKGTAAKTIEAHTKPAVGPIYAVAWSPDAKVIATGSYDQSVKLWDADSGKLLRELGPGKERTPPPAPVGTGAPAVIGAAGGGWLNLPGDPGHRDQVFSVEFSPNGKLLATSSSDRTVKLWETATGEHVRDFVNPALKPGYGQPPPAHPGFVHAARFTPDGAKLVTVGTAPRGQGYVAVWAVADGKLLAGWDLPYGPAHAAAVTPDGAAVLIGCGPKVRTLPESDAVVLPLPK